MYEDGIYYLIICSRGPGTETIIVKDMTEDEEFCEHNKEDILKAKKKQKDSNDSVVGVDADVDEGPVIITKEATLADIYKWLVKWKRECDESWSEFFEEGKTKDVMQQLHAHSIEVGDALLSAYLRAFINPGNWTSCNSWRNELMSEKEFNTFKEATGQSVEQLNGWDCKILQASLSKYTAEGRIIKKGW